METSYGSSFFNSNSNSISSSNSNISYLSHNNNFGGPLAEHYFSAYTSPSLPPLPALPSSYYPPPPTYPLRGGGNHHRNEQTNLPLLHHHHSQPRNGGSFMLGRESAMSTILPPVAGGYSNMMYPTWPTFEPTFNMRPFPTLTRPVKQRRPKMTLQKRLLVNARERERMRVLNKAFESLRDALPCYIADGHMAKITTLKLAINYIQALTDLLNEHNGDSVQPMCSKTSFPFKQEQNHEELFNNIFRDSTTDGLRPVFKNLEERLAICKKT